MKPTAAGRRNSTDWLFPGRPGFTRELLDHGIDSRPAHNVALIALVADIPAPILADILDLHINTAVR